MNKARKTLLAARKGYSQCASLLEKRIAKTGLSAEISEQIVGIGVAGEWVRRAAEMERITYVGDQLNRSQRQAALVELLRYGFAWFALNAVFTRPALLTVIGSAASTRLGSKPQTSLGGRASEFEQFLRLFQLAPLPERAEQTRKLHELLARPTTPRLPDRPSGTSVPTLSALHTKYLPRTARGVTGRAVADAATSGSVNTLDLPTLLYAFRNWAVHGNALDGAFGTRPGFLTYVGVLVDVLAEVHVSTASELLRHL